MINEYTELAKRIKKKTKEKLPEFAGEMYLMLYDVINSDYFHDKILKEDIETLLDYIDGRDNGTKNLKPCPFCGSEAKLVDEDYNSRGKHRKRFIVMCKNENCRVCLGDSSNTKQRAINAWNTRVDKEDKKCTFTQTD